MKIEFTYFKFHIVIIADTPKKLFPNYFELICFETEIFFM